MPGEEPRERRRPPRGRDTPRDTPRDTRSARGESPGAPPRGRGHTDHKTSDRRPPPRPRNDRWGEERARNDHGRGARGQGERGRGEQGQRHPPRRHDDSPRFLGPRIPAQPLGESFTCGHCGRHVGPLPSGGHHRNHCPYCLYSRHVDNLRSGDRANPCGGLMAPIGAFQRRNGEHVVVHHCEKCGFERFNRIAADDDFDLVLALPVIPPRTAGQGEEGTARVAPSPAAEVAPPPAPPPAGGGEPE